jgi:hypothetical protein
MLPKIRSHFFLKIFLIYQSLFILPFDAI